jgi:DNA replication protein
MKAFRGFPSRMEFTSVPNLVFSDLLPRIDDLAELRVTLLVMAALYRKKGAPRSVGRNELLADAAVVESLHGLGDDIGKTLGDALDRAVARGTFIGLAAGEGSAAEDFYLLNDAAGRQAAARVAAGELTIKGKKAKLAPLTPVSRSDIIATYEDAIGLCDPNVLNKLREAERRYPADWIVDAIREAALQQTRTVKDVMKLLEAWSVEAGKDGTYQPNPEKPDPDRYVKGEYGHVVKR